MKLILTIILGALVGASISYFERINKLESTIKELQNQDNYIIDQATKIAKSNTELARIVTLNLNSRQKMDSLIIAKIVELHN